MAKLSKFRHWKILNRLLFILVGFVVLIGLSYATPLHALESRSGEQVIISQDEVIDDDLYVVGETIVVDGTVRGDVIGAGRQITINGIVDGDVIAAGQAIAINGRVNDDVRIAGQILKIGSNAQIDDDVIAAGASFESEVGSAIAGDVSFMGAQALIAGTVEESVQGTMAALELQGTVGENVNVTVGEADAVIAIEPPFAPPAPISFPNIPSGLTVTDSAQVGGTLAYRSPSEAAISPAAQISGDINRSIIEEEEPFSPATLIWGVVQRWITLLVVGSLLLWLLPGWTQQLGTIIESKTWASLGWGIVVMLIVAAAAIAIPGSTLLLTALIGAFLWNLSPIILGVGFLANSVLVISFLLFIGYVPAIALSYRVGQRLLQKTQLNQSSKRIVPLALGLLIFVLLTAIPVLGGILWLVTVFLGLGALWIWVRTLSSPVGDRPLVAT